MDRDEALFYSAIASCETWHELWRVIKDQLFPAVIKPIKYVRTKDNVYLTPMHQAAGQAQQSLLQQYDQHQLGNFTPNLWTQQQLANLTHENVVIRDNVIHACSATYGVSMQQPWHDETTSYAVSMQHNHISPYAHL
jgi:hypothetical protein